VLYGDIAGYYDAKYTEESAHGQYVSRQGLSDYAVGNCAHCHEQHASMGGDESFGPYEFMLFAPNNPDSQPDNFCFQCHTGSTGSLQTGVITNYDYSSRFGGEPYGAHPESPTTIYDAFNPTEPGASSHDLKNIQDFITGRLGFTSRSNPCNGCHNPHYAQKNYPVNINSMQGVNTAVRNPLQNQDEPRNLWGDESSATSGASELMSEYASAFARTYQAPYYYSQVLGPSRLEPAGDPTSDGSNLPNFIDVCMACHSYAMTSTRLGRPTRIINWTSNGDAHGTPAAEFRLGWATLRAPYVGTNLGDYVLSCTDCHEPHGSPNQFLLRTCVNGKSGIDIPFVTDSDGFWWNFCTACHDVSAHLWDPDVDFTEVDCFQNTGCHAHGAAPLF
jgi:cytochrome c553